MCGILIQRERGFYVSGKTCLPLSKGTGGQREREREREKSEARKSFLGMGEEKEMNYTVFHWEEVTLLDIFLYCFEISLLRHHFFSLFQPLRWWMKFAGTSVFLIAHVK